jgi:hypothetical protein
MNMMEEDHDRSAAVERGEEWQPVADVDDHVRTSAAASPEAAQPKPTPEVRECGPQVDGVPTAAPDDPHTRRVRLIGRRVSMSGAQYRRPMPASHQLSRNPLDVYLRTAALRVGRVAPVEEQHMPGCGGLHADSYCRVVFAFASPYGPHIGVAMAETEASCRS